MSPAMPTATNKLAAPPSPPEPELFAPRMDHVPAPRFASDPLFTAMKPALPPRTRPDGPPVAAPPETLTDPNTAHGPESGIARSFSKNPPPDPPTASSSEEDAAPPIPVNAALKKTPALAWKSRDPALPPLTGPVPTPEPPFEVNVV